MGDAADAGEVEAEWGATPVGYCCMERRKKICGDRRTGNNWGSLCTKGAKTQMLEIQPGIKLLKVTLGEL